MSGFEILDYTDTYVTYTITVYNEKEEFEIIGSTDTIVTYSITVNNWSKSKNKIDIILEESNKNEEVLKTYTSKSINDNRNKYNYKVTNLKNKTDYIFYSLNNYDLAIGNLINSLNKKIVLTKELNINPFTLSFVTNKTKISNFIWILLIFLLIIIILEIFILWKKLFKND